MYYWGELWWVFDSHQHSFDLYKPWTLPLVWQLIPQCFLWTVNRLWCVHMSSDCGQHPKLFFISHTCLYTVQHWNVSTNIECIAMKSCADIHGLQRANPWPFPLAPPWGSYLYSQKTLLVHMSWVPWENSLKVISHNNRCGTVGDNAAERDMMRQQSSLNKAARILLRCGCEKGGSELHFMDGLQ